MINLLTTAIRLNNLNEVKTLIEAGADLYKKNLTGMNAFKFARKKEIINFLKSYK